MNINFKDKKTWFIIGAIVLVVVVVIIIIRRRKSNETDNKENNGNTLNTTTAKYPLRPSLLGLSYTAENGSYGWQIKLIQKALNDLNSAGLTVDGKFGPKTLAAVKGSFATQIGDNEITEDEFNQMLDTFRAEYNQHHGGNYATNDDLKLIIKS